MGGIEIDVDLTDPALYAAGVPHEVFADLRARGSVLWHPPAQARSDEEATAFWSVLGHAELQQANRDWATFTATDSVEIAKGDESRAGLTLVSMDPPKHTRLRRLIHAGFTPRMVAKLEDDLVARAEAILDEAGERGEVDFVRDVAYQLPMHVIADIVGIPDADRPWVFERTDLMLRALDPGSGLPIEQSGAAQVELFGYAQQLTADKRSNPADDVWTLIAQAEVTDDDGTVHRVEGIELEMFFVILAIAGSETTRNAISQGLLALLDHPDQLAELRADRSLWPVAAEEVIRWSSPVLFFGRTATREVSLGGIDIAAGDRVVLWYPSGNRDERVFDDPFRFDVHRWPNPHVAFGGGGPHFCLGANLARKEVQVLLGAVVDRFDVEVLGPPVWAGGGPAQNVGVSVDRLPVRFTSR